MPPSDFGPDTGRYLSFLEREEIAIISVTAGPSRQAKLGVSSQTSYTVDGQIRSWTRRLPDRFKRPIGLAPNEEIRTCTLPSLEMWRDAYFQSGVLAFAVRASGQPR